MALSIMREDSPDEMETYIINIDNFAPVPMVRAAVPITNYDVHRWVQSTTITDNMETVGIHAEPRRLNPRLIRNNRLQPCLAILILCLNTRILVLRLHRFHRVPAVLTNLILRNNNYTFVGIDILSMRERLGGIAGLPDDILPNVRDVRDIVALHTGREELRTAGLKMIVREVLDFDLNPWPRVICPSRWWFCHLTEALVMHGAIRAFMAVQVSLACTPAVDAATASSPAAQPEQGQSSNATAASLAAQPDQQRQRSNERQHRQHNNINHVGEFLIAFLPLVLKCLNLPVGAFLILFLLWVFVVYLYV